MKHYTTVEQSKKLLELGLNPESADMYFSLWEEDPDFKKPYIVESAPFEWKEITVYDSALPCWSLGALLEVMPRIIETPKEDLPFHLFQSESEWMFQYGYPNETDYSVVMAGNTPIEAAFNMVVYLLENGFIKKESNQ